ncbi:hypothetical protein CC85DRAFT_292275 [Cutaneotrichosporon oleaginosum]|uniref:Uncharacterized protein n=1 Tax=Cutaneotrichosporon oleaginosum TaxID=879819 RepID=A0A0J0XLV4_9TREE|nr:uncharacterized protein CC85DRAFT_292275 [Cutaneotrichosporon oleaginosum]KLT42048.1 hypothetical protein CC85DRAFT_292275 [Cutaneotrichosporon oleaginosum]TXT04713.1 hypothetical protein COLE_07532 [Cutaneotrichosporon oleaginosum]
MPPMNRVRRVSGMRNLIQRSPQVSFAEQAPPPRPPKTRGSVDLMFDLAEGYVRNRQHIQPSSHSEGQGAQQRQFKQTGPEPEQHDPAKDHATATTPKLEPAQREGGRVPSLKSLIPSKTASSSLKPGTGSSAEERGHTFSQRVVPADKVTTSPPPRPRRSSRRGLVKKLSIGLTYRDQNPPQALARDAADALTCQPTRNLHIAAVVQSTSDTAHEPNHIVPRQRRNAISHGSGVSRSGALPFPELQTPKAISQEDAVDNENGQSKDCGNHEHHNGENLQNVALQPGATQPTSNQEANETVLDGQAGKWQPFRKSFIRGTQTDQRAQPAVRERKISFSSIVSKGSGTTRAISRTLRKSLARQEPAIRLEEDSTENVGATSNVKNTAKCDPTSTLTHVAPQDADIVPQDSASTAENLIKAKESLNDSLTDCESRCAQTAFSTITAVSLGAEANTSLDDTWPPEQLAAVVAKVEARAAADGVDLDTVSIDLDWGATRPMTFRRRVSELVSAGTAMSNEEMAFWERNKFRASIFGVEGIDFSEKLPWRVYSSGKSPKDKPTWPTKTEASGGGVLGSELDLRDVTYGNSLAFQARQQAAGNARAHQSEAPPPTPPGSSTSEVMPRATNSREASREHEHDTPLPRGVLRGAYHTTLTVDTQPTAYLMTQLFQPDVSTSLESEDMNLTALGLASPTTPTTSAQEYLVRGVLRSRAAPLPAPRVVSDPPSHQQSTTARMAGVFLPLSERHGRISLLRQGTPRLRGL